MQMCRSLVATIALLGGGAQSCDVLRPDASHAADSAALAAPVQTAALVRALSQRLASLPVGLAPAQADRVARTIAVEARRAGLSPGLVAAVIHVESSGYPFAVSRADALGLMQLLPETAEALARDEDLDWDGPETLFDPVANVRLGIRYLDLLVARFGDLEVALAAYNAGPSRVAGSLRAGRRPPRAYARRVLDTWTQISL